jgi:hypothetical protein
LHEVPKARSAVMDKGSLIFKMENIQMADEFDRINNRFELLLQSAKKGDSRALKMGGRAIAEMRAQIAIQYFNRSGPRVLRKSYGWEFWMDKAVFRGTKADR